MFPLIKYRIEYELQEIGLLHVVVAEVFKLEQPGHYPVLRQCCDQQATQLPDLERQHQWQRARGSYTQLMQKLGRSFKKNPPAIEGLIEGVRRKGRLPMISAAVDAYNLAALRYGVCIGAHDAEKIQGEVCFGRMKGGERICAVGAQSEREATKGDYGYWDSCGLLAHFDSRDADRVKITANTSSVLIVVQGAPGISLEYSQRCVSEAAKLMTAYCGGEYRVRTISWLPGEIAHHDFPGHIST